jgi:hypothetical protein
MFVEAVKKCLQRKISQEDLMNIRSLLLDFYIHYETYVKYYLLLYI